MYPSAAPPTWCVVRAGERNWRVHAGEVLDIVGWPPVTRVPLPAQESGAEILGVFLWHGAMVPLLQMADLPPEQRRQVVVVRAQFADGQVPIGLAASAAALTDDAASAELLAVSDLMAKMPPPRG